MNTDETITIYDVAREAGVSMATVSRVVKPKGSRLSGFRTFFLK